MIQEPFDKIAITILTDPTNDEFWLSMGTPLNPHGYCNFVFILIEDSSILMSKVSFEINWENLTANKF